MDIFDYSSLKYYAQSIINNSISEYCNIDYDDYEINKKLTEYENTIFNLTPETNILLDNNINYKSFITLINDSSPINLKWLKSLSMNNQNNDLPLKFPIKLVVIAEGITEETLLPEFAKFCELDFDKYGVQMISAGGKNQVVKLFYTFAEQLKIPIFVLLDSDAKENYEQIKLRMRKFDKIHLINAGEFEDILPISLIKKALNDYFKNLNSVSDNDFYNERMVENLEEIFKIKGFHEFKKSEFAQLIKNHITSNIDISDEISSIVKEIKLTLFSLHR
ncbi:hypothetical protein IKE67_06395 [bacterium]|nr:hypothetical protein [bacterium]